MIDESPIGRRSNCDRSLTKPRSDPLDPESDLPNEKRDAAHSMYNLLPNGLPIDP